MTDIYTEDAFGWTIVDYTQMKLGSPVGEARVIQCPKCKRNCVRKGGTKIALHRQSGKRERTGKLHTQDLDVCKAALPKLESPQPNQIVFPWCPENKR